MSGNISRLQASSQISDRTPMLVERPKSLDKIWACDVFNLTKMEEALSKRHDKTGPYVVVIDTDPYPSTEHGGTWWEVGVPEVSDRAEVRAAHEAYVANKKLQRAD